MKIAERQGEKSEHKIATKSNSGHCTESHSASTPQLRCGGRMRRVKGTQEMRRFMRMVYLLAHC